MRTESGGGSVLRTRRGPALYRGLERSGDRDRPDGRSTASSGSAAPVRGTGIAWRVILPGDGPPEVPENHTTEDGEIAPVADQGVQGRHILLTPRSLFRRGRVPRVPVGAERARRLRGARAPDPSARHRAVGVRSSPGAEPLPASLPLPGQGPRGLPPDHDLGHGAPLRPGACTLREPGGARCPLTLKCSPRRAPSRTAAPRCVT